MDTKSWPTQRSPEIIASWNCSPDMKNGVGSILHGFHCSLLETKNRLQYRFEIFDSSGHTHLPVFPIWYTWRLHKWNIVGNFVVVQDSRNFLRCHSPLYTIEGNMLVLEENFKVKKQVNSKFVANNVPLSWEWHLIWVTTKLSVLDFECRMKFRMILLESPYVKYTENVKIGVKFKSFKFFIQSTHNVAQ